MPDNRVSARLSQADQQAVLAAVNTIREKLPFLIDLTPDERRTPPRMTDRSRGFVSREFLEKCGSRHEHRASKPCQSLTASDSRASYTAGRRRQGGSAARHRDYYPAGGSRVVGGVGLPSLVAVLSWRVK